MKPGVEIIHYDGDGFKPVMAFKSWRLAYLNYAKEASKEAREIRVERHLETDEVFVLLQGEALFVAGDDAENCTAVETFVMKPGVIYNAKQYCWHHCIMKEGSSVLLVEEADTSDDNTIRQVVSEEVKRQILAEVPF